MVPLATNGTIGKITIGTIGRTPNIKPLRMFMVLPMVPVVQGSTNGTIGNTIGTNGNANGTIGSPNGTIGKPMVPIGTIGKPMVPLATNGTIGKISNGTIWRTPNRPIVDEGIWFQIRVVLGKNEKIHQI